MKNFIKKFYKKFLVSTISIFVGIASLIVPSHAKQASSSQSYGGGSIQFNDSDYFDGSDSVESYFYITDVNFNRNKTISLNNVLLRNGIGLSNKTTRFYLMPDYFDNIDIEDSDFISFAQVYNDNYDIATYPFCDVTFSDDVAGGGSFNLLFDLSNISFTDSNLTFYSLAGYYNIYVVNFPISNQPYQDELQPFDAHCLSFQFDIDYSYLANYPIESTLFSYQAGYDAGVRDALANSTQSVQQAYNSGYNAGVNSVDVDALYQAGYAAGVLYLEESVSNARENGYSDGFYDGRNSIPSTYAGAYDAGVIAGRKQSDAYQVGYAAGFAEGRVKVPTSSDLNAKSLIWTIASTPFESFKTIFNFSILGINLVSFFFGIISIGICIYILKKVF